MRTFNYSAIKNQKWDSDILGLIAAIYKEAGKQELYLKQHPKEFEKLVEIAKIQSTEASNVIEGIVTTNTRIRQLVEENYGEFDAIKKQDDVISSVFGHDHRNNFVAKLDGIDIFQSSAASFRCYGNKFRGVRVIEINEKNTRSVNT